MRDSLVSCMPWLLSMLTITMNIMAGNKHKHTWLLGLFLQILWLTWIILSETWGLIPLNVCLWIIYTRNYILWNKDTSIR